MKVRLSYSAIAIIIGVVIRLIIISRNSIWILSSAGSVASGVQGGGHPSGDLAKENFCYSDIFLRIFLRNFSFG